MAQTILGDSFAPEKRGLAFSLYGITPICAPAIGPTLGGWITDNYSWGWIFYINVPVGIVALLLVSQLVEDPPYIARLKARLSGFDFIGFSLVESPHCLPLSSMRTYPGARQADGESCDRGVKPPSCSVPGVCSLVRRYVLAAGNGLGDYVCRLISAETK
jgi:MFS family permease